MGTKASIEMHFCVGPAAWCRESTSVELVGANHAATKRNGRLPRFYIDVPALRPGNRRRLRFHFLCAAIGTVLGAAIDPYVVGVPFVTFTPGQS
jgi:hypothetical protein